MARTEVFLTSLFSASCWPEPHRLLPGFDSDAASPLMSGLPRGRSMTSLTPATRLHPPASHPRSTFSSPGLCPRGPSTPKSPGAASSSRAFCQHITCQEPSATTQLPEPSFTGLPVCATVQSLIWRLLVALCLSAPTGMGAPADGTLSGFPVCPQRLVQSGGSGKGKNIRPPPRFPSIAPT